MRKRYRFFFLLFMIFMLCGFDTRDFVQETDMSWIYSGKLAELQSRRVKLSAVGDLMVHTRQHEDASRKGDGGYNYDYSFSYISRLFQQSDIVAGNLETVLAGADIGFEDFPTFAVPDEFAYAIKRAGFTLLSTANNHSLDQGRAGLLRTIQVLDELGVSHVGTYASPQERDDILLIEENGISFAFLSYTYGTNGIPIPNGETHLVNMLDEALFTEDIRRAKSMNPDFVIVFPHMGTEYESYTRQIYRDTVTAMLHAGADIVLASHPHVVQPAEVVTITDEDGTERKCFVAYSMGNFISGQRTRPREAGVVFNLYFEKVGEEKAVLSAVSYIPTWVKFYHKSSSWDIAVMSVYDILNDHMWGRDVGLSQSDLERVRSVQTETTKTITGTAVPAERLAPEYFIFGGNQ